MKSKCLSCERFWKTQPDKEKKCFKGGSDGGLIYYCTGYEESTKQSDTSQSLYDASHTVQIKMKLNLKTDADILEKLGAVGNKQGYIKSLIRADIKK